jgi:hypothetical protein
MELRKLMTEWVNYEPNISRYLQNENFVNSILKLSEEVENSEWRK